MSKKLESLSGSNAPTCSPSSTPERDNLWAKHDGLTPALAAELLVLAGRLEQERNRALDREAAIIQFCEAEMGWEFFRAEFKIGDNPSKSLENAKKLREFLSENVGVLAHADENQSDQ